MIAVLLLLVNFTAELASAQNRKAGINGATFLKIGVGARAVGLGSAMTSQTGDANDMFWNPAGIVLTTEKGQVAFSYNDWLAGLSQKAVAATYNFEDIGTIGVGFMTFGVSGIPGDRDQFPSIPDLVSQQIDNGSGSTYDFNDLLLQATYARYVSDQLSLGVTAKFISEKIDDQRANAVAFDLGSVYHIGVLGWSIGARINNLGSDIKYYDFGAPLPLTFSFGTSISPYKDESSTLMLAIDAVKPQDGQQYYYSGIEYSLFNMISVRGGYKFNYSGADDGGNSKRDAINTTIEGFSAGASVGTDLAGYAVRVDYAYTKMEILDSVHRFSLLIGFK
jgi:hypothetical protein